MRSPPAQIARGQDLAVCHNKDHTNPSVPTTLANTFNGLKPASALPIGPPRRARGKDPRSARPVVAGSQSSAVGIATGCHRPWRNSVRFPVTFHVRLLM